MQNYVFLLKIVCKEKKNSKSQPKKIVGGIMNCSYYSKLKKKKVAQQNGIVDVQRKNTVRAFALLYIRKKSTNL